MVKSTSLRIMLIAMCANHKSCYLINRVPEGFNNSYTICLTALKVTWQIQCLLLLHARHLPALNVVKLNNIYLRWFISILMLCSLDNVKHTHWFLCKVPHLFTSSVFIEHVTFACLCGINHNIQPKRNAVWRRSCRFVSNYIL